MLCSNDAYADGAGARQARRMPRSLWSPHLVRFGLPLVLTRLQGGYNLTSISKSALAVTRSLIGELPDRLPSVKPTDTGVETVEMVALYQSRFWPCLYPKDMTEGLCPLYPLHSLR